MTERLTIEARVAEVKRRLPIGSVVERHVKLTGTAKSGSRRGPCPFHGGSSASFGLKHSDRADGFAHCFGCDWGGDVVKFVRDIAGISFMDALAECERMAGLRQGGEEAASVQFAPVQRERRAGERGERQSVEPIDMGRWIWGRATASPDAVRRYFIGRGIPAQVLTDARMAPFRYLAECPCWAWKLGEEPLRGGRMLVAPAIAAIVRVPFSREDGTVEFLPTGLHLTYLNPAGDGTMVRAKPWRDDAEPMLPKRRMLGPVGRGAVLLGDYRPDAHLYVGEGNETVLSAMALRECGPEVVGVATLSLDNLQGKVRKWGTNIWPLHAIQGDPERPPFLIPGHSGPVTGLVDSDMSPLRGPKHRLTGEMQGEKVVERKGGPIVQRAITGAERAQICGTLLVKGWRAIGAGPVEAVKAPAGMDFNDVARAAREVV